jgi:hypothetical protein
MIPRETSVLMPIINWISILHEDRENVQDLLRVAKERVDVVKDLRINISETTLTTDRLREFRLCLQLWICSCLKTTYSVTHQVRPE